MQETNFKGRSLLTLADYSSEEIQYMLDTAKKYKDLKKAGTLHREHEGKSIALLFEKASTRTRCAFVVAAADLGIHPEYLGKDDIQLGKKETVEDTAKVLGRMFDGIEFRGFAHATVEELARHAGVPVWNGLTDTAHPTQVLADFLTIQERLQRLKDVKFVFVGDGRNNMANSLMEGAAKMGMDFRIAAPKELFPDDVLVEKAKEYANDTGAKITITDNLKEAVAGADVIYTDVWVSMGEEAQFDQRITLLKDYQVNMDVIKATGNENVMFMHCLPAFHDRLTTTGEQVYQQYGLESMEVTDEVFRSKHSIVFDQAENRMHTIKAVIALTV
jgi:ornithine carbamoyltransferase